MPTRAAVFSNYQVRPMKNSTGSTITEGTIVKIASEGVVSVGAASTDNLFGVALSAILDGREGPIQVEGKAKCLAGEVLSTAGVKLTTDSTGRCVAATVSAGTSVGLIGTLVTTATAADQIIEVELNPQGVMFTGAQAVADRTALKAIVAANRWSGLMVLVLSDLSRWCFSTISTATDTSENLVCTPGAGTGRWMRVDKAVDLKLAVTYATADATLLFSVPVGFRLLLSHVWMEITADFAGGSSSSVGVSSDVAPHETKSDLFNTSLAAALTASIKTNCVPGASYTSSPKLVILEVGSSIRWDRVVDAFTAGTGYVHAQAQLIG